MKEESSLVYQPWVAFLLAFLPGVGHLYINRRVRAFLYGLGFFGPLFLTFMVAVLDGLGGDVVGFLLFVAVVVWLVNMLDMVLTLVFRRPLMNPSQLGNPYPPYYPGEEGDLNGGVYGRDTYSEDWMRAQRNQNERFQTILLSFIPGLGHFQLGLMQRGFSLLVVFFGSFAMIGFVVLFLHINGFLSFMLLLPVIWLYSMFDAVQLLTRKQKGYEISDRSVFEEIEQSRESGKKSRMLATLLALIPGAGHMYLGLLKRGTQFMAAFLLGIYILDQLRLSFFMFLIPLLWFYSLFDALQMLSKYGREELKDVPLVDWVNNHQKWVGFILVGLGAYYLADNLILQVLDRYLPKWNISFQFHRYFQTILVSLILIGGGLKFLSGGRSRPKKERRNDDPGRSL